MNYSKFKRIIHDSGLFVYDYGNVWRLKKENYTMYVIASHYHTRVAEIIFYAPKSEGLGRMNFERFFEKISEESKLDMLFYLDLFRN